MNNNLDEIELQEFIKENYAIYGDYVNFHRTIPYLDGLKKVHRRAILGTADVAIGKVASTVNVVGAISQRHPFGTMSIEQVVADLVRYGELEGQGQFGIKLIDNISHAATRYTKCGLSRQKADYYLKFLEYAPKTEGEVDIEPEYLITPVPYCLINGALNWGLGIQGRTPAFTYSSLIEAYFKDDPNLLESNFGYKLNKNDSDLKELWEIGTGSVSLSMTCQRLNNNEIVISGSGEIFKPALSMFNENQRQGNVLVQNESTDKIGIRISRAYRSRVDMDEVFQTALRASKFRRKYNILVVLKNENGEDVIQTIGIKKWLDLTINQYIDVFNKSKEDRISKLRLEIEVLKYLPEVGKLLLEDKSDSQILKSAKVKGITQEVLERIKRKQISSLRKSDWSKEIENLEKQILSIELEDAVKTIKSFS